MQRYRKSYYWQNLFFLLFFRRKRAAAPPSPARPPQSTKSPPEMLKFNFCYEINFNICNILLFRVLFLALPKTLSFSAGFHLYKSLIYFLLSSTEVVFGKNLIRTWVEFGKKMVYGKQGVMSDKFRQKPPQKC